GPAGLVQLLARQRIISAPVEPDHPVIAMALAVQLKAGAFETDRGRLFKCEAEGLGCGTKGAGPLGHRRVPVAAKVKRGRRLEIKLCHFLSFVPALCRNQFICGAAKRWPCSNSAMRAHKRQPMASRPPSTMLVGTTRSQK